MVCVSESLGAALRCVPAGVGEGLCGEIVCVEILEGTMPVRGFEDPVCLHVSGVDVFVEHVAQVAAEAIHFGDGGVSWSKADVPTGWEAR